MASEVEKALSEMHDIHCAPEICGSCCDWFASKFAAVRAEQQPVGHVANCHCHIKEHHGLAEIFNAEHGDYLLQMDCKHGKNTCTGYTDPRCLPGLLVVAKALLEDREATHATRTCCCPEMGDTEILCDERIAEARAEVERLKKETKT